MIDSWLFFAKARNTGLFRANFCREAKYESVLYDFFIENFAYFVHGVVGVWQLVEAKNEGQHWSISMAERRTYCLEVDSDTNISIYNLLSPNKNCNFAFRQCAGRSCSHDAS